MNTTTSPNPVNARRLARLARLAAGAGLAVAATAMLGGAAFAVSAESGPPPVEIDELLPDGPVPEVPELALVPELDISVFVPIDTVDDGPGATFVEIPDIPIDSAELPECLAWEPGLTGTVHSDPVAGTVTVTIQYTGDAAATCDTLFVVHSIRLDAAMVPIGLLAEEQVSMDEIAAAGGSVSVTVPIDPCYTRVLTDGPEAYILADTTYGDGCPPDTTDTTVPDASDTTEPPAVTDPGPTTSVPSGQLPETGASSTTLGLLGVLLIVVGLGLACAARGHHQTHRPDISV